MTVVDATLPPKTTSSWYQFLLSPAISFPASLSLPSSVSSSSSINANECSCSSVYWHQQLLQRWQAIINSKDFIDLNSLEVEGCHHGHYGDGVNSVDVEWNASTEVATLPNFTSDICYGSYIVLAAVLAEKLSNILSMSLAPSQLPNKKYSDDCDGDDGLRKVGIAIPEGPFLPLCILAVHSLNVAVSENWLELGKVNYGDDQSYDEIKQKTLCKGIVIIPLEADEAPERLQHMIADSKPNLILVAPGKDSERMRAAVQNITATTTTASTCTTTAQSSIQLVDFAQLVDDALTSLRKQMNRVHPADISVLLELLWPSHARNYAIDSLRYQHSIPGCFDVARLVALGLVRLLSTTSLDSLCTPFPLPSKQNDISSQPPLVSHIVYTSGTTGKPKGCVSSLASLQNYIRAKNLAHSIDCRSRVLLASAISFDPCFSDILSTCVANATLCLATREQLYSRGDFESDDTNTNVTRQRTGNDDDEKTYCGLTRLLRELKISHILCTPTLWASVEGTPPNNVPSLQIVALGGESIPKSMIKKWARSKQSAQCGEWSREYPRLCATYGVTEACVYQTFGEVLWDNRKKSEVCNNLAPGESELPQMSPGQSVGLPLFGTNVHICQPYSEDEFDDGMSNHPVLKHVASASDISSPVTAIGEVVISGAQVDVKSCYLHLDISSRVFVRRSDVEAGFGCDSYFYRTGDLGYINHTSGNLHILGRIHGDSMVKINGVRIELSEIEHAIIDESYDDSDESRLVLDCIAALDVCKTTSAGNDDYEHKKLVAYCIVSSICLSQLGIFSEQTKTGVLVPPGPLLTLLRARCDRQVRKGCTPNFFVLIDRIPLSPTGKRCRSKLPNFSDCSILNFDGKKHCSLWEIGKVGSIVAETLCECLNLQPYQRQLVTSDSNFFSLGGDSLAATRIIRRIYAIHHGIRNSRNLGGPTGTLDGTFSPKYLIHANTLGDFVDHLESRSIFETAEDLGITSGGNFIAPKNNDDFEEDTRVYQNELDSIDNPLYENLIEAIILGQTSVALGFLDLGVDPNIGSSKARLGKVTDRRQQRALFTSNPLHLACLRGNPYLVRKLLQKGCKATTPDASGSFPIHLACSRRECNTDSDEEDCNRLLCVKYLLDSETPLTIKDGNRQTILHSAARSGHCHLLKYLMDQWQKSCESSGIHFQPHDNNPGRIFDWRDRWYRTPVHWAVLNQRTAALRILIDGGCSAFPSKPKSGISYRATNVLIETPLEMCRRLYGESTAIGAEISSILCNAKY